MNKIRRIVVGVNNLSLPNTQTFNDFTNLQGHAQIDNAFDQINNRYGNFTIRTADILHQYAKETELSVDKHEMRFHGSL